MKIRSQKTSNILNVNSKCLRTIRFSFIHSYINYANIAWANTNKTKLKKLFVKKKNKPRVSYLIKTDLLIRPSFKTLNALNVYQMNLLQALLFMHKIKTNSSHRTFLHQFETINHKYATWYSRYKEPNRETNYAKYWIHVRGTVIWNSFLNSILCQHFFKHKIREKIFEFEKELTFF